MKVFRYALVAALAVAMSGGNQMFAMTGGSASSSSIGASSSSADSKEAKAASSVSSSTSVVAEEIYALDLAIAAFDKQIKGMEQKRATSGRLSASEIITLTHCYEFKIELVEQKMALQQISADAPVVHEQNTGSSSSKFNGKEAKSAEAKDSSDQSICEQKKFSSPARCYCSCASSARSKTGHSGTY